MSFFLRLPIFLLLALAAVPSWGQSAAFVPNKGQWEDSVLYRADIPGGNLFVSPAGLTYHFIDGNALHEAYHHLEEIEVKAHVLKFKFQGAQAFTVQEDSLQPYKVNFFIGNNPNKWRSNIAPVRRLVLKNVWPHIDIEYIFSDNGLKTNYLLHHGARIEDIRIQVLGAEPIIGPNDELLAHHSLGTLKESTPVSFYVGEGEEEGEKEAKTGKRSVAHIRYKTEPGGIFSFSGKTRIRSGEVLVIDPNIIFSTFSGSVADNFGFTATYDREGHAYSGGTVFWTGFPVTPGAYQMNFKGGDNNSDVSQPGRDCGLLKFSPDGKQLLWATYLGGIDNEQPHSMIVDHRGDLVVFGTTHSSDFPTSANAYDRTYNGGGDIFVTKLSPDGSRIVASTFIGGNARDGLNGGTSHSFPSGPLAYNYGDQYRGEVMVDKDNNIYFASCTRSANFPAKGPAARAFAGVQDAVVCKFTPDLSDLEWSTLMGGRDEDAAYGLAFDTLGNLYVCGGTIQSNQGSFPATLGTYAAFPKGGIDGFLAKILPNGHLETATFLGTPDYDQAYFVQVAPDGAIYTTGQTEGQFPVTGNVFRNPYTKQFIASFSPDLKQMQLSTTIGSGDRINFSPSAFVVDLCGRISLSGWGGRVNTIYNSKTGNVRGLPLSPDAWQHTTDGNDFYLIILARNLSGLIYGSYFGGPNSAEHVDGGTSRFDREGKIYQSVCAGCGGYSDFPTTPNAWSRTNKGLTSPANGGQVGGCNNAVFKIDLNSSLYAPFTPDTTIVVTGGEEINYSFTVVDRDADDSVYFDLSGNIFIQGKVPSPIASYKSGKGQKTVSGSLNWQTTCEHVSKDTYVVVINMRDNGCPTPRESQAFVRIVVQSPEPPNKPKVFCLQRMGSSTVGISWDDIAPTPFFKSYRLMKRWPDGREEILYKSTSQLGGSFTDNNAHNHQSENYCYYLYGVSECGVVGDSTRTICTPPDPDSIPPSIYAITATVAENEFIRFTWEKYPRDDFYFYEIYRRENKPGKEFIFYQAIGEQNDTFLDDRFVNVHESSYCYQIVVRTQCGLYSDSSNLGCTILLEGDAEPFVNHLRWSPYSHWPAGINQYHIFRRDPSTPEKGVGAQLSQNRYYSDTSLNYDEGLYWYRVVAEENIGGHNATSMSNEIRLVQKPILWVPNVFSPNRDSTNDFWRTVPVFVKDYKMTVFNRWGEYVWSTDRKKTYWDGTFIRREPFDGVFIWQATYTGWDGSTRFRKGFVTIIK